MSRIVRGARSGVPFVRLVGEVGAEEQGRVEEALSEALCASGGRVVIDLRAAEHLHYRIAGVLAAATRSRRRLEIVGATPYVRQLLCLVGAAEAVGGYADVDGPRADRG